MSRASIQGLTLSSSPPEIVPEFDDNDMQRAAEELARADWLIMAPAVLDWLAEEAQHYIEGFARQGDAAAESYKEMRRDCMYWIAHNMDEDRAVKWLRDNG